MNIVVDHSEK